MLEILSVAIDAQTFPVILGVLGLLIGSFLNVVVYRLPKMMEMEWQASCAELRGEPLPEAEVLSLVAPRSRCPHCGHLISALENIPIISYLFLRGKCKACRAPISFRYPLVEAFSAFLAFCCAWHFGVSWQALEASLLLWSLLALALIDFDTQLLPDDITLPLLWAGLIFNLEGHFIPLADAVIGAAAAYLFLWAIYWVFKFFTGKEGMGYGDFKLAAALGAWLGWSLLPCIILIASLIGAVVGISLILIARRGRNIPFAFGPYLAIAGTITLFFGKDLLDFLYPGMF